MNSILSNVLNSGKGECQTSEQRLRRMARQPGRGVCSSLVSIKKDIEKLSPKNKKELIEAVKKLEVFSGCNKMRP